MLIEKLQFLSKDQVRKIASSYELPLYIYSESKLKQNASEILAMPHAFGFTPRFAMKACPNASILRLFSSMGLQIDASSGYEVIRAIRCGIPAKDILLSAQECAHNLKEIIELGIEFNACSLKQIESFGRLFPQKAIGLRFNPGLGTGGNNRTNVGGPGSSFGIWHEQIEEAKALVEKYNLRVKRIHTHIGSGTDPEVWQKVSKMSIEIPAHFPDAEILNLGGGYKVSRMSSEKSTDIQTVGEAIKIDFEAFYEKTGRKLKLEIEPGTFLVANACSIISRIDDIVSTGERGYTFYKTNTGMTDILRPSLYGAQHPIVVVTREEKLEEVTAEVLVVGHCCESGDILTPQIADPEGLKVRMLQKASIDDYLVIEGAGAYCSSMSAKNYNSFPESAEYLLRENGDISLIRKRQTIEQIIQNETLVEDFSR